ncbi:DUF5719 family protein [Thermocatellispora tengchongensis]|uniref:DUF5719 family protein n=1 Tax=Thermocatellispora tengchongensis TaxID=1073253 RepID=UPI0036369E90
MNTVCPDPGDSVVSAVAPGREGARGGAATVTALTAPGEKAGPAATLDQPGKLWQKKQAARTGPLIVAGDGAMAAGLEAAQTATATSGARRGLAGVRCVEPAAEAWFVGPGPAAAAEVTLYVANPDSAPASVEVAVYAGEGPVVGDHGFMVEPGEHRTVNLKDIAPSPLVMAVSVRTGSGRVASAVRAEMGEGRGVDWLPQAAAPAKSVVVPGIPGGGGRRELYVAAPGESDAVVQVKAITADGFYALKNRETVEVPAGSVATLDLSTGIGGQPAAIALTSETPIVAGMVITATGTRLDVAFSAGAAPIDLGSVVADNRSGKDTKSALILSAPGKAAKVSVQVLPAEGAAPAATEAEIPAARTEQIALPKVRGAFAVAVTPLPGSGPVYGGRVLDQRDGNGLLITAQPLAAGRTWALVPPLTDSPSTVLP